MTKRGWILLGLIVLIISVLSITFLFGKRKVCKIDEGCGKSCCIIPSLGCKGNWCLNEIAFFRCECMNKKYSKLFPFCFQIRESLYTYKPCACMNGTCVRLGPLMNMTIEDIRAPDPSHLKLLIKNNGNISIEINSTRYLAFCNGRPMDILTNTSLDPGESRIVEVNCSQARVGGGNCCCPLGADYVEIKVTSPYVEMIKTLYNKSSLGRPACV